MRHYRCIICILLLFTRVLSIQAALLPPTAVSKIPLFHIHATSLYDAGFQLGKLASIQIQTWFQLAEFRATETFVQRSELGARAFAALKQDNTAAFPELVEEMKGMADGAGVSLDQIWMANLTPELESLQPSTMQTERGHCTDIFGYEEDSISNGIAPSSPSFLHGHNEDWSEVVKKLWYFVKITPLPSANFDACSGMAYPGTLLGYAATWSKNIYSTQNTLFPRSTREDGGLACTFVQRRATCGTPTSLDQSIGKLHTSDWAASASVNVVALNSTQTTGMANVEIYENDFNALLVSRTLGNYSHMNMFKHLKSGEDNDKGDNSTERRQQRVWQLDAPKSLDDMRRILGDIEGNYPIYRKITLATLILTEKDHLLRVWIDANPHDQIPDHIFNLSEY